MDSQALLMLSLQGRVEEIHLEPVGNYIGIYSSSYIGYFGGNDGCCNLFLLSFADVYLGTYG